MMRDTSEDQVRSALLGALVRRLGGEVTITEEEIEEMGRLYGRPTPLIVAEQGRERAYAVMLLHPDEVEERAEPLFRRSGLIDEEAHRAAAALAFSIRLAQATHGVAAQAMEEVARAAEQARRDLAN